MMQIAMYLAVTFSFTFFFHGILVRRRLTIDTPAGLRLYAVGGLGPLLGAVSATAFMHGRQGMWDLLVGSLTWQTGTPWLLVAALAMVFFYLGGIALYVMRGGEAPRPLFKVTAGGLAVILAQQVYVQIAEEYGWRGFLLPHLSGYMGALPAALLVGVIWAAWHLPMFWVAGSNQQGSFGRFTVWVLCWSVMMAALYSQTGGSVLSAMLFHMSLNVCYFAIRVPKGATNYILALEILGALAAIPYLGRPLL